MSEIITVHGYLMAVERQADQTPAGDLYSTITYVINGEATFGGTGTEEPSNLGELRTYGESDISGKTGTWVGDTGSHVLINATGRKYYWDGSEWLPGEAPAS